MSTIRLILLPVLLCLCTPLFGAEQTAEQDTSNLNTVADNQQDSSQAEPESEVDFADNELLDHSDEVGQTNANTDAQPPQAGEISGSEDLLDDEPNPGSQPGKDLERTEPLEEVIVTSNRRERSERMVSRVISVEEIYNIPALRDDALGALDTFAGIASLQGSFDGPPSQGFYFRGGNQSDNHLEIDGLGVSYIYHLGGPFSFSVLNGRLVERLKFYPSNPDISYPNVNGGVIEVRLRQPQLEGFSQAYDIGTLSAGAMIEGGLGTGKDGFWLAVRRSYIDFFLSNTSFGEDDPDPDPDNDTVDASRFPEFYDIQGRWYRSMYNGFTDLTFMVSRDVLGVNIEDESDPQITGMLGNRRAFSILGWRLQLEPSTNHLFATQINYRLPKDKFVIGQQGQDDPNPGGSFGTDISTRAADLNIEHSWKPNQKFRLHYGVDLTWNTNKVEGYIFTFPSPDVGVPFASITNSAATSIDGDYQFFVQEFFVQTLYSPIPDIAIEFSLRTHNSQRSSSLSDGRSVDSHYDGLSPRFNLSYFLNAENSIYYRWGNFVQLPTPEDLDSNLGNPTTLDLIRSRSNLVGYSYITARPGRSYHELSLELWHREFTGLVIPDARDCTRCLTNRGTGLAYGLDLEWTFRGGRNHLMRLVYSWLFTERRNRPTEPSYPSTSDQPHTFKILYSGPLTRSHNRWRWGFFMAINSGQPYTPVIDRELYVSDGEVFFGPIFGAVNSRRYPTYLQFNIGFSYTSESGFSEYRFSILSLHDLFRANVTSISYDHDFERINTPDSGGDDFLVPSFVMVFRL